MSLTATDAIKLLTTDPSKYATTDALKDLFSLKQRVKLLCFTVEQWQSGRVGIAHL
jgi:hypothetical protein